MSRPLTAKHAEEMPRATIESVSTPFQNPEVKAAFEDFPDSLRPGLLLLRELIFEEAAAMPAIGRLEECLKWGQPAYLTPDTKSASTIRLGMPKSGGFALYVHCQTTLISDFSALFPGDFIVEGNRAVCFEKLPPKKALEKLRVLIRSALSYHRSKKNS